MSLHAVIQEWLGKRVRKWADYLGREQIAFLLSLWSPEGCPVGI